MPFKKRLKDFLEENHVKYITMIHSKAYTSQEIAAILHVPGKIFAKTVILNSGNGTVMAVLPATHRVNLDLFKQVAHTSQNAKSVQCRPSATFMICPPMWILP